MYNNYSRWYLPLPVQFLGFAAKPFIENSIFGMVITI